MPRPIRVQDLPDTSYTRALLRCQTCGGEYSAYRGDYFMADPQTVMRCHGRPLQLVTKRVVYEEVSA